MIFPDKLQHCGRMGVAGGQRYVAHENGLAAEQFTQNVIATVATAGQQQQEAAPGMMDDNSSIYMSVIC